MISARGCVVHRPSIKRTKGKLRLIYSRLSYRYRCFLLQRNGFLPKILTNFYWWYNVWFSSHYVIMCVRVSVTIIVKKKYWTGTVREKSMLSGEQREIRDRYLEMGKRESKVKNQTGELFLEWNFKNRVRYWSDSEEKIQKREIRKWRIGSRKPEVPTCT